MYCTVLELFANIAIRTVGLHQLLHYDVTTHCCKTLAQPLAMLWASEHFPMLPSHLVRNNSVSRTSEWIKQRFMHS